MKKVLCVLLESLFALEKKINNIRFTTLIASFSGTWGISCLIYVTLALAKPPYLAKYIENVDSLSLMSFAISGLFFTGLSIYFIIKHVEIDIKAAFADMSSLNEED